MAVELDVFPAGRGTRSSSDRDGALALVANRQHGVVSRGQLTSLGFGAHAIDHRVAYGRLHRLHRGVYAVGHTALTREGRWMAATLVAPGVVLSHRAAGALWGLLDDDGPAEVTLPSAVRPRAGLRMHASAIADDERTLRASLPVTTVARTLLDLGAVLRPRRLALAVDKAEALRLAEPASLATLLARYPGRRGVARLRAILAAGGLGAPSRSELEARFLAAVRVAGLPLPQLNARLASGARDYEVDAVWRDRRLAVELDGRAFHGGALAFEADRARDRALAVAGWRVIRITWRQLHDDEAGVLADLARLLAVASPR